MNDKLEPLQNLTVRSFERLLVLYPPRFRREFSGEIRQVFLERMQEAVRESGQAWLAIAVREILALAQSVIQECWYELWIRKGNEMEEGTIAKDTGGGGAVLQQVGFSTPKRSPSLFWVVGWTLLTTLVYPLAVFMSSWFSMPFLWLSSLGTSLGLWSAAGIDILIVLGFFASLAISMAAVQSLQVTSFLPQPWRWFAATAVGILCTGPVYLGIAQTGLTRTWDSLWVVALILLLEGLLVGTAQWLYLRTLARDTAWTNPIWWIPLNILGMASILLSNFAITVYIEPETILFLALPGVITGLGLWFLLRQAPQRMLAPERSVASPRKDVRFRRLARVGLALVALVPLFFFSLWAYAASQIALAKSEGVYPTVEEAVIKRNWQGLGGAQVVSIDHIRAGPNRRDGSQPHVWFATGTVNLDRIPEGHTRAEYMTGSYYVHVRDGWVSMGEGVFPEFVGWVMELYNLEGARDFEP